MNFPGLSERDANRDTPASTVAVMHAALVGLTPGKTKCIMKAHS